MKNVKLVCFDLDDTLIRDTDSVMIPCILNGKEKEQLTIIAREESGELDYISADHLSAKLFRGLVETDITDFFLTVAKPLDNIGYVVDALHGKGISCIVITVGPKQVAKAVCNIWGFDSYYGTEYEVVDGLFTGNITLYNNVNDKVRCLIDYCEKHNITPDECIAVGDGITDIPVFEYCGKSIAINAPLDVKMRATHSIDTDDLSGILRFIL